MNLHEGNLVRALKDFDDIKKGTIGVVIEIDDEGVIVNFDGIYIELPDTQQIVKTGPKTVTVDGLPSSESVAQKADAALIQLMGGIKVLGVALTQDQVKHLSKWCGVMIREEENAVLQAGDVRDIFRYATEHGLRLMAMLGKYLLPGEDPVEFVGRALIEQGFDITNDWDD